MFVRDYPRLYVRNDSIIFEGAWVPNIKLLGLMYDQDFCFECVPEKYFSYFSTLTYVVGTQNILVCLKIMGKKIFTIFVENFCLSKPMLDTDSFQTNERTNERTNKQTNLNNIHYLHLVKSF